MCPRWVWWGVARKELMPRVFSENSWDRLIEASSVAWPILIKPIRTVYSDDIHRWPNKKTCWALSRPPLYHFPIQRRMCSSLLEEEAAKKNRKNWIANSPCWAARRHLLPRRHQEPTKQGKKGSEAAIRESGEGRPKRTGGSKIEGPEMPRFVFFIFFGSSFYLLSWNRAFLFAMYGAWCLLHSLSVFSLNLHPPL